jgi:hypothetical protein
MIEDYTALSNAPNSPDLNGKYLGLISSDFIKVADALKEASYQIKKRGFSDFPIFVTSQRPIEIGQKLIGVGELHENKWNYHASMMEIRTTQTNRRRKYGALRPKLQRHRRIRLPLCGRWTVYEFCFYSFP